MAPDPNAPKLQCLSAIISPRDEEGCIASTVDHLHVELRLHEIVVVDDGSSDRTWPILQELKRRIPALSPIQNDGQHGFGRAGDLWAGAYASTRNKSDANSEISQRND